MSTQPHTPMARHCVEGTSAKHLPRRRSAARPALGALLGALVLLSLGAPHPVQGQGVQITVSNGYVVPADIPGGAEAATLQEAAAFAWEEFIALNWPAVAQTGVSGDRETPDTTKAFGSVDPTLGTPLVWETFRHKLEIFPGTGSPHGGANYDALPQYVYNAAMVGTSDGQIPPCDTASPTTPFNNLDEQSEIGLDQMFAGAGPGAEFTGQQILFQAKANRVEYGYVVPKGWIDANHSPLKDVLAATITYVQTNQQSPPPGSTDLASFPNGTVELKAAWRHLTAAELASGRFHVAPVRFYRQPNSNPQSRCYQDADNWGLVGLHIIQKTPTAPYFIFATFEQADNLQTESGNAVEDEDGNLVANQTATPLDPAITSVNAISANPPTPDSVQTLSPATANATPPANRLYYVNTPGTAEPQGFVYVNRRVHSIPQSVIAVNQVAHGAIKAYNQANNLPDSPWLYYKLVNVQYQPIDKPTPGVDYTAPDAATYYQANIVVETDHNLQVFSGRFQQGFPNLSGSTVEDQSNSSITKNVAGLITDFNVDGTPTMNVAFNGHGFNMGGCMGCHGNAQVNSGSDFSFILSGAGMFNLTPDVAGPEQALNVVKYIRLLLP